MKENIIFNGVEIFFRQSGDKKAIPVVLLHGYLESMEIWNGFAEELAKQFYVVTIDLPGHGKSGVFSRNHRMDDMSEAVLSITNHLKINRFHLVGHSMGGYVTLAFRERYQNKLISYVLFHSSCVADTEEKRTNRDREINLVMDGKKHLIINTNIPRTFAEDNLDKFKAEVERVKKIASQTSDEGIIACLSGMKERPDRCNLLLDDIIPLLLILGKKDNIIPFEDAKKLVQSGSNVELAVLSNSGHMGFIEEKDESLRLLRGFFEGIQPQITFSTD